MQQNLRKTFSLQTHRTPNTLLLPALSHATCNSLEALLTTMHDLLQRARKDLMQPRQQVLDRILLEAAQMA